PAPQQRRLTRHRNRRRQLDLPQRRPAALLHARQLNGNPHRPPQAVPWNSDGVGSGKRKAGIIRLGSEPRRRAPRKIAAQVSRSRRVGNGRGQADHEAARGVLPSYQRTLRLPFSRFAPSRVAPASGFPLPEGRGVHSPSGNLLDTIYACQFRQDWYRSYAQAELAHAPGFVSALAAGAAASVATTMMQNLLGAMGKPAAGQDRLRSTTEAIEATGVLIMANGIVGSNTRRKLDPNEFRGFVLSDQWAPVIFLNA